MTEVYYRAGIKPKDYQKELEHQLKKTTLGISLGLVKTFSQDYGDRFDPYGHFGQPFNHLEEKIHQYKICELKPPSIEKVFLSETLPVKGRHATLIIITVP